jgi:hypothetical protein
MPNPNNHAPNNHAPKIRMLVHLLVSSSSQNLYRPQSNFERMMAPRVMTSSSSQNLLHAWILADKSNGLAIGRRSCRSAARPPWSDHYCCAARPMRFDHCCCAARPTDPLVYNMYTPYVIFRRRPVRARRCCRVTWPLRSNCTMQVHAIFRNSLLMWCFMIQSC